MERHLVVLLAHNIEVEVRLVEKLSQKVGQHCMYGIVSIVIFVESEVQDRFPARVRSPMFFKRAEDIFCCFVATSISIDMEDTRSRTLQPLRVGLVLVDPVEFLPDSIW